MSEVLRVCSVLAPLLLSPETPVGLGRGEEKRMAKQPDVFFVFFVFFSINDCYGMEDNVNALAFATRDSLSPGAANKVESRRTT